MLQMTKNVITRGVLFQLLAACVVTFTTAVSGMILSWDTPMIPRLVNLNSDEVGWIVSLVAVGSVFGTIFAGFFVDYVGRKRMLWCSFVPAILFYGMSAYKLTYLSVSIGHVIGGVGIGITYTVIQMYLAEIAENKIRGTVGSAPCILRNLGNMVSYTLGVWLSPRLFSLVSLLPVILGVFLFFFIPETPYQLLMFGNREDAQKSLSWLRGGGNITEELETIEKYVTERRHRGRGFRELLRKKGLRTATLLSFLLSTLMEFCGFLPIMVYADVIFIAADYDMSGDKSVMIFGAVILTANLFNSLTLDWLGRRKMLASSAVLSSSLLLVVGGFFHLKSSGYDVSSFTSLPLFVFLAYGPIANFGLLAVPAIIMGEIFPMNVKATAMTFTLLVEDVLGAVSYKLFQILQDLYGLHTVFYFYALCTIALTGISIILLPETKGRSFEDIENDLENLNFCIHMNSSHKTRKLNVETD